MGMKLFAFVGLRGWEWEEGTKRTAKVIHILSVDPIGSDHQSPVQTSFTTAFTEGPKVTLGQRIWKEMRRHAKSNCKPIASVDKVIPTGPRVLKTRTF